MIYNSYSLIINDIKNLLSAYPSLADNLLGIPKSQNHERILRKLLKSGTILVYSNR